MNNKIYKFFEENIKEFFKLPKYANITIGKDTVYSSLPWTPARRDKFERLVKETFGLDVTFRGTIKDIATDVDYRYLKYFFGSIWQPRTETFEFTGWEVVNQINALTPKSVLDVGCGYNQFKGKVNNLIGIDPFNPNADYMIDILDYNVDDKYDVIMVFGSINFNDYEEIDSRLAKVFSLLDTNGKVFMRANPGLQHVVAEGADYEGPWVDVFPWSFEYANEFAKKYDVKLESFKQDANNRLFFIYSK